MEELDLTKVISIFESDYESAEFLNAMRDLASLPAVLKDLSTEKMYHRPVEIIRFLNIIQLLNRASLGLDDVIDDENTLYYRYLHTYKHDEDPPKLEVIQRAINILARNNWIVKQSRQIRLRDRGKRLMDGLIRMGNDSLAYYLQDDIGRSLFQAKRDAEISAAYDDKGISGGNKVASMIFNLEVANEQLEQRQLEFLADRNALPQLEQINDLMIELEDVLKERLNAFKTLEESLVMSDLVHRGTAAMTHGTALSLSILSKYIRFVNMQQMPVEDAVSPERVRQFILSIYDPPLESQIPVASDIFSFMEQDLYEGETFDGLWIPVKFAAPIGSEDIAGAIDYLKNYEPKVAEKALDMEDPEYEDVTVSFHSVKDALDSASWQMTKSQIDTTKIDNYLKTHGKTELEELIVQSSSEKWHDAILSLLAVSALSSSKKIKREKQINTKEYEKEWEWQDDEFKGYTLSRFADDDE